MWLLCKVSTKSALDPSGVWQAWGMASLKAGNLSGAREKFGRFLKAPVDRNQLNLGPLLLQEVVQHLETTVQPTLTTVGRRWQSHSLSNQHLCCSGRHAAVLGLHYSPCSSRKYVLGCSIQGMASLGKAALFV